MSDTTPTINRIIQDSTLTPGGQVQELMRVEFMVGTDGPFTELIPLDEFTQDEARKRIATRAETIRALRADLR